MQVPITRAPSDVPTVGDDGVSNSRRSDVQGLRAVAVLLVVGFHSGLPVPGGFVGVDVFFVISGFVITAMLRRELAATGKIDFARFYKRRFQRLTPALALVVTAAVIVSALLLSPFGEQQTTAKTAIGAILLVANAVIARTTGGYFDAPAEYNPLLNVWSLSVEEQFYIIFPSIMGLGWLGKRRHKRGLRAALIVLVIASISFELAVLGSSGSYGPLVGFYSPLARSWEFAAGALLALSTLDRRAIPRKLSTGGGPDRNRIVDRFRLHHNARNPLSRRLDLVACSGYGTFDRRRVRRNQCGLGRARNSPYG